MSQNNVIGCIGNKIRVRSGRYFDFANPQPEQFTLGDIAGALSNTCRYGGQTNRFYSVAEHSLQCAKVARSDGCSPAVQAALLMHDAAEAFTGDVVKPLKIMLSEFWPIEERIEEVIADKYGVNLDFEIIKIIDIAMLFAERRVLFDVDSVQWPGEDDVRRLNVPFQFLDPYQAESTFLEEAAVLGICD